MASTSDVNVKMVTADRERKAKDLAGWHKEAFEFRKKLVAEKNAAAKEEASKQAGVVEVSSWVEPGGGGLSLWSLVLSALASAR